MLLARRCARGDRMTIETGTQTKARGARTSVATAGGCFICAFGAGACAVPLVEGRLLRVWPGSGAGRDPVVLLECADGGHATVSLERQAHTLARELLRLGPSRWRGLWL